MCESLVAKADRRTSACRRRLARLAAPDARPVSRAKMTS